MKQIVIIGGGILGSSTAFHLSQQGHAVTVIDENHRGKATHAAAGIICPWVSKRRNQAWYQLVKAGAAYYPQLMKNLQMMNQTNSGYKKTGALWLHDREDNLMDTYGRAQQKRLDAPEMGRVSLLSPKEVQSHIPALAERFSGVFIEGGARVDGMALNRSLQQAAEQHGAVFLKGRADLRRTASDQLQVIYNEEVIPSDELVVTNGAWAKALGDSIHLTIQVAEQKAQIVHLQTNHDTANWPVIMPPGPQYLLAFENGKIVAVSTHEDNTQFNPAVTAGGMNEIFSGLLDYAPGLSEAEWIETRVGFRPVVPHYLPVFGALPEFRNVWLANGLGSSGLTTGPYIGYLLSELIQNRQHVDNNTLYPVSSIIGD
ncbi:LOW QUALITY PROTEIN: D-amino acid dehydrogenase small subunit [Bacillus sp. JCM 19046]|nr:LOW QUALITY PROTEIN: D-amino acid dehydrogenase small subunit [Bacillus sp. JCM 19046]